MVSVRVILPFLSRQVCKVQFRLLHICQNQKDICFHDLSSSSARSLFITASYTFMMTIRTARASTIVKETTGLDAWGTQTHETSKPIVSKPKRLTMMSRQGCARHTLRVKQTAIADELASAAELVIGQADEGIPVALVRGYSYQKLDKDKASELAMPRERDLFR